MKKIKKIKNKNKNYCMENRLSKTFFSDLVLKLKRSGGESQQSGFGFDLKNPPGVWICGFMIRFWISPKKRKIRLGSRNPDLDFLRKMHRTFRLARPAFFGYNESLLD